MKLHEFIPSFSYLRSYFLNYTNINRMTNWLNTLVRNTISSVGLSNFLWIYSRIKSSDNKQSISSWADFLSMTGMKGSNSSIINGKLHAVV